jgi:hypothetical protein
MLGGVAGDRLQARRARIGLVQVAAKLPHASIGWVQVRVLEPRENRAALELEDARARPHPRPDLLDGADGGDAPRPHGDRVDAAPRSIHRLDGAAAEDELGCSLAH